MKSRTDKDNEAVLIKARHNVERIKHKADVAAELRLKFAKRKRDLKKKVIALEVKQSIVEETRTLNDVKVERRLAYVRACLDSPPTPYPNCLREYWIWLFLTMISHCSCLRHLSQVSVIWDDAHMSPLLSRMYVH